MASLHSLLRAARPLVLASLFLPTTVHSKGRTEEAPLPERARLETFVYTLCAPEFEGRSGRGGIRAAGYIADQFQRIGLKPAVGESFLQKIPGPNHPEGTRTSIGANVVGLLPGSDPSLRGEYLMLTAHYDHLGIRGGQLYPGADDNASGVAMMLEVARAMTSAPQPPRRSVLFVAFDLEEAGLIGSRHFVADPPIPLDQVRLFLTADLIGGSLGGVCKNDLFVLGSEFAPGLRPMVRAAAEGRPIRAHLLGSDILMIDRSDYGPFRARKIPHLFFTTGESPAYHTPDDLPETLDYAKLETITRLIHQLVANAAAQDVLPPWAPTTEPSLDEARGLHDVMAVLLEHKERLQIPPLQGRLLGNTVSTLQKAVEEQRFTASQRAVVLRVAQLVLATVL